MGKIYVNGDMNIGNFSIETSQISSSANDLYFSFSQKRRPNFFKDIKFGYEIKQGGNIKQYGVFPPPGVRYKKTNQDYLVSARLHLVPDELYILFLWAEIDSKKINNEFTLITPKPEQLYKSWTWDSEYKVWKPPIPLPNEEGDYKWDDKNREWIKA